LYFSIAAINNESWMVHPHLLIIYCSTYTFGASFSLMEFTQLCNSNCVFNWQYTIPL